MTKYLKSKSDFFLWPGCGGGWGVETKAVWQMFKCGTIQISNHLHTVEHVVQSKSGKKKKKKIVCWGGGGGGGGGGGYCFNGTALMAQSRQRGHNELGPTEKKLCVRLFFVLMLHIKFQVPSSSCSL